MVYETSAELESKATSVKNNNGVHVLVAGSPIVAATRAFTADSNSSGSEL